jgi:hypothetical protein
VSVPKFNYSGLIVGIYPASGTQPARVWVKRDGDLWGRTVHVNEIEVPT